jgi:hypothetical protein
MRLRVTAPTVLSMTLGLVTVAAADDASLRGKNYADAVVLFFLGLLFVFVPVVIRVLTRNTARLERLALIVLLGLALYGVKILGSPTAFTFIDEYIHLRNTQNILATHHLFGLNPLLPTAAYYPGLAAACAGLVDLTGLSPFVSGLLIIGAARLLISACFFLVAEKITGSSLTAAGASVLYAANPMFLFWSSSFSYEDLGLPLAAFVIWWTARTRRETSRLAPVITVAALAAVTVTHHVAAFALAGLLGAWWLAEFLVRRAGPSRATVGVMALVAASFSLAWFFLVARPAASYLFGQNIRPALQQLGSLLSGHAKPRQLYRGGGTAAAPGWYMLAGFAATGLIGLALPPAVYRAARIAFGRNQAGPGRAHGPHGVNAPLVIAIAVAAAFPASQLPRLTAEGGDIASRSSEYLFTGLGCVLALLLEGTARPARTGPGNPQAGAARRWRTPAATGMAVVILVGEATVASPYTGLLPEASDPPGYPWSVQPDVIAASVWARRHLGIDQPFAAGIVDSQALATYGEQDTVTDEAWPIFLSTTMSSEVTEAIISTKVRYLFVDWRMTDGIPSTPENYYFSPWEPQSGDYKRPMPAAMLRKFAETDCARLIYHSGPIQIFDVTQIENRSCVPSAARATASGQAAS